MRFENGNHQTEYMLADSLVELSKLCNSPSDISILRLAHKANIHRNTFYYHFKDIEELIEYTLKRQYELLKGVLSTREEFLPAFFDRNYKLIRFARHELGTDKYLDFLRNLILADVQSPSSTDAEEKKAAILANLIVATTLAEDQPGKTIIRLLEWYVGVRP